MFLVNSLARYDAYFTNVWICVLALGTDVFVTPKSLSFIWLFKRFVWLPILEHNSNKITTRTNHKTIKTEIKNQKLKKIIS